MRFGGKQQHLHKSDHIFTKDHFGPFHTTESPLQPGSIQRIQCQSDGRDHIRAKESGK